MRPTTRVSTGRLRGSSLRPSFRIDEKSRGDPTLLRVGFRFCEYQAVCDADPGTRERGLFFRRTGAATFTQGPTHGIAVELNNEWFSVHHAAVRQRGIKHVPLAYAMPPCKGVIRTHGGASWGVTLLICRNQNVETWQAARIRGERVPFILAAKNCR